MIIYINTMVINKLYIFFTYFEDLFTCGTHKRSIHISCFPIPALDTTLREKDSLSTNEA
jgi:hypothetical protein